jgi:hypothetical protein
MRICHNLSTLGKLVNCVRGKIPAQTVTAAELSLKDKRSIESGQKCPTGNGKWAKLSLAYLPSSDVELTDDFGSGIVTKILYPARGRTLVS